MQSVLECRRITKYFPGIKALDEVDFNIRPGEVHALIGENGAGKSTLVKIITGIHQPDSGVILQNGEPVEFRNPIASQLAGIAAIHQEATMFPELSVTENIYMGHHLARRASRLLDWKGMKLKTRSLLEKLELEINLDTKVKDLSVAQRHMVEIVKALSVDAKIVIMDEPTSALSLREVEDLYKIIRQLKATGQAIVFISHKFEDIYEIADYFTVLRDGRYIGEGKVSETEVDEIVRMMVGRSLDQMFPKTKVQLGDTILKIEGLSKTGIFKDISFDLHRGEILGFFGLVGAGRSEVMQAVFGIDTATSGKISVKGTELSITSPPVAMDRGIAYVPEDRQIQGTILDMSIQDNITLPIVDKLASYSLLNFQKEGEITREFGERMEIKTSGWTQAVNSLSGGNQQKVVLAKWLATHPEILIMDEPTKGIDVATKARVHEFISQLAAEGLAIILISSEIPEILGMADRIVVMHEGKITACLNPSEADSETLVKAAMGNLLPQESE
ncbi:MAG: sugar ABC transporter ATP-binding protein [Spirochaetaceae bacterium]|nr:MAG: sugar ABC transporter ATP-binding protein [Spirochaetaceae bacterium]